MRPALIVADESTVGPGVVVVVPSTSEVDGKEHWPYVVAVPDNVVGNKRALFLVQQIRALSTQRLRRLLAPGDDGLMDEVALKLGDMLKLVP